MRSTGRYRDRPFGHPCYIDHIVSTELSDSNVYSGKGDGLRTHYVVLTIFISPYTPPASFARQTRAVAYFLARTFYRELTMLISYLDIRQLHQDTQTFNTTVKRL